MYMYMDVYTYVNTYQHDTDDMQGIPSGNSAMYGNSTMYMYMYMHTHAYVYICIHVCMYLSNDI